MLRVTPLEGARAPLLLRGLNWLGRRTFGQALRPLQVLAHNQALLLPYLATSLLVGGKSEVDPRTRLLAMHMASQLNGCDWCMDFARMEGTRLGLSMRKMESVVSYSSDGALFSDAERAALRLAEDMTRTGARVSDEVFAEVRRHFSERATVELVVAIATENFYNRVNGALGLESQGFCGLPLKEAA
ncbi:MAG TPA: carboxymuconolactone decarboxylase family protein [Chloroflexota bacterium]